MRRRRGFTLIEVLIATSLLGFSLVVMFGFHTQAVRSNMHARKLTDCVYLAQGQLEELLSLAWNKTSGRPDDLKDGDGSTDTWGPLYHPSLGLLPHALNSNGKTTSPSGQAAPNYFLTWEVDSMDVSKDTWVRVRVRCTYKDNTFNRYRGTTVATYRYRDEDA